MVTSTRGEREIYLRDKFARNVEGAGRVFSVPSIYSAWLFAGLFTLALCFVPTPPVVASVFVVYLLGLAAWIFVERRRYRRALAGYQTVMESEGPLAAPGETRHLPRYLLEIEDAVDPPMLDSMLLLGGDSRYEFTRATRSVTRSMRAYAMSLLVLLAGMVAIVCVGFALLIDHAHFQSHISELALVTLGLVPAIVAIRESSGYRDLARGLTRRRVEMAKERLATFPVGPDAYTDGRVVKFRDSKYVIEVRTLGNLTSFSGSSRSRRAQLVGFDVWLIFAVLVSSLAFVVHPISGILVQ